MIRSAGARRRVAALALGLVLLTAACSGDDGGSSGTGTGDADSGEAGSDTVSDTAADDVAVGDDVDVAVALGPNSALTAVVTVSGAGVVETRVDAVSEDHSVSVPPMSPDDGGEIALVGLRAETTYTVTVTTLDADGIEAIFDTDVTTGALPDDLPDLRVESDPAAMAPGITLFNLRSWATEPPDEAGYLVGLDEQGEVVWYYRTELGLTDVSPTDRGTLLVAGSGVIVREIDLLGNTIDEWGGLVASEYVPVNLAGTRFASDVTRPVEIDSTHHEVSELPNGNILTISTDLIELDEESATALCGDVASTSYATDVVAEFTPDGEVVQTWSMSDVFDVTARPGSDMCRPICVDGEPEGCSPVLVPPNWFYPQTQDTRDWTHGNAAIVVSDENTLIVSLRHLDAVVALRYHDDDAGAAGELLWELGPDGDLELVDGEWSYHQHAVEDQADGTLLLYDNGNDRPGTVPAGGDLAPYSRAVVYDIDAEAGTVTQVWEHRDAHLDGRPVYTTFLGDADRLANGNVLITHGGIRSDDGVLSARIVEVVPGNDPSGTDDTIVFDLTVGTPTDDGGWTVYRSDRLPTLYFAGMDLR